MRHPVEERLQRLLAILADVAGKGPVPLAELSRRYRVSAHQLRKDLTLAATMGIPPYDLPGETPEVTFRGDTVEVWVPRHFAEPPALTRPEALAVLTAGRAALALNPGLDALATAMDKLADALELGGGVEVELEMPACLDQLRAATAERRRVEIVYWSAWRDELTERVVEPLQVVFLSGEWYLLAWDVPTRSIRRFRVDRIEECVETGEGFDPRDFEPLNETFVAPPFAELVQVRFPDSAGWVTEYVDMQIEAPGPDEPAAAGPAAAEAAARAGTAEQRADESAAAVPEAAGPDEREGGDPRDGGFTAVVTSVGDRWLERLLLRTGGEVVAPEDLVGLRRRAAQRLLATYAAEPSAGADAD